jgi:hypothetical protein
MDRNTEDAIAAGLFLFWLVLLLPWLVLAPLSLMAFDAGPEFLVYVFVWSIWTYPISVGVVWWFRRDVPLIAFLPCLNIATGLLSGYKA